MAGLAVAEPRRGLMPAVKRTPKPKPPPDPRKLAREQAGSYRSGDSRFVVRQDHGGKWYVTDAEQTNEFGLELVLGPFGTIADAKAAVETQREQPAGASPGAKIRSLVTGDRERTKSAKAPKSEPGPEPKPKPKPGPEPEPKPEPEPEPKPEPKPKRKLDRPPEPALVPLPEAEPEPPKTEYRPAPWRPTGDERDAVAGALRRINDAWISSNPRDMRDFLDPDVVFVQPGFAARTEGRDAAIRGYMEFVASAVVHAYAESELTVDLLGHTAVASYRFEIAYETEGKRVVESGRDLFVFDRSGTRWRAVWRLLLPDASRPAG